MNTATDRDISIQQKFEHLWFSVGNTPMVEIAYEYKGKVAAIYAKCEHYNLTGSIKDRMALYILQKAYEQELIRPGHRIVEATSGNTGISFAAIGRALDHPVTIIMPDWLSKERYKIVESMGAEVMRVSKEDGGFITSIRMAEEMAGHDPLIFLPRQFENKLNAEAHQRTTAKEIWQQLTDIGKRPEGFVAGVGTGGTIMGMSRYLKNKFPHVSIHPVEPAESPVLTGYEKKGVHRIQGISDEFIPAIVDLDQLNDVISVHDGDAILMAQKMAGEIGLAVGISSGANIIAAIKAQQSLGMDAVVVTVLPDSNKKYLSTDLLRQEPVKEHYLSAHIRLKGFLPIKGKAL